MPDTTALGATLRDIETAIYRAADSALQQNGRAYWRAWADDLRYLATRIEALRREIGQ